MIDISKLSTQDRKALMERLAAEEQAARQLREQEIEHYKQLVCRTVDESFPHLERISVEMSNNKRSIRDSFSAVVELKGELYGVRDGQRSHTFMNEDGTKRITLGCYVLDAYDDTVEEGIAKVRDCINAMAKDDSSRLLVDTVLKLLSKDSKGTLKASRVLQLQQLAEKNGDATLLEGVKIIRDAYRPIESKSYIKAEQKDHNGKWISIPLGMTEAD